MLSSLIKEILSSEIKKAKSKDLIDTYNQIENKFNSSHKKPQAKVLNSTKDNYQNELLFNYTFITNKPKIIKQSHTKVSKIKSKKSIYYKALALKILRETKLDDERFKKRIEEANLLHPPIVNAKSVLLASQNKSRNAPLYQRVSDIQNQHQKNLMLLRETYALQSKIKDYNGIVRVKSASCIQSWLTLNDQREIARKERIKQLKSELEMKAENDLNNNLTFKPNINERSKRIVHRKRLNNYNYLSSSSLSVIDQTSQRLYQSYFKYRNHKNELRKQMTPSFKPEICN